MKCEIKIVESISNYNKEMDKRIANDEIKKPVSDLVMTPETFSKVFSPERIKLLQRLYKNNLKSIYQLAKELDKPYEVVFRNIKYLEGIGLVKIVDKDNKKSPQLACEFSINILAGMEV